MSNGALLRSTARVFITALGPRRAYALVSLVTMESETKLKFHFTTWRIRTTYPFAMYTRSYLKSSKLSIKLFSKFTLISLKVHISSVAWRLSLKHGAPMICFERSPASCSFALSLPSSKPPITLLLIYLRLSRPSKMN